MSFPVSTPHLHYGTSYIEFYSDDRGLFVTIDTDRLHMRPPESSDLESYVSLYGDPQVMEKLGTGQIRKPDDVKNRIDNVWRRRWENRDPYGVLAVVKNDGTDDLIGNIALAHGDLPGESEFSYVFMKHHWRKGYGTEAATAIVKEYAPATVKEGYLLEGLPLTRITATARPDNLASVRILENVGMVKTGEEIKYGALRYKYVCNVRVEISRK